ALRRRPWLRASRREPVHELPAEQGGAGRTCAGRHAREPRTGGAAVNDPLQELLNAGAIGTSPFPPNSPHPGLPVGKLDLPGQAPAPYLRRRFIAPPERFAEGQQHPVGEGDRIDNVAAQYLGDPELYWQVADANGAMEPAELTEAPGRRLRITLPEGI